MTQSPAEMANKGQEKYSNKLETMRKNYADMKNNAISNYKAVGFKNEINQAYENSWGTNPEYYNNAMSKGIEDKWRRNWTQKMFGTEK